MCCHTRQMPLKPGSPWKFLQLMHRADIPQGGRSFNCLIPEKARRQALLQGSSAVAPHRGLVFFHPCVCRDFHICSAASFRRYRRSLSNGGPSGICRPRSMKTLGSLTHTRLIHPHQKYFHPHIHPHSCETTWLILGFLWTKRIPQRTFHLLSHLV